MPGTSYSYKRMKMIFKKGPLFYAFFNLRLFFVLLFARGTDLLISNDLDTLLANYLVSRIRRIPLLYDSHEYFTEVPELKDRAGTKKAWERIERHILPRLKYAMTVSDSIAAAYEEKYGIPFVVIRNISEFRTPERDPSFHDHYSARYKIIYQGALNIGRGLEMMITAMQWIPDTLLLIAGDGDIRIDLHHMVQQLKLSDKVVFPGKIPPRTLHKITSQCDLGVSIEEDLGLNYRMALPNKIFDYIQSRIPVLCSDLPEMLALVEKYGIGEVIIDRDPKKLASQVLEILQNAGKRKTWAGNLDQSATELCWDKEEIKLRKFVELIWRDN